MGTKKNNLS